MARKLYEKQAVRRRNGQLANGVVLVFYTDEAGTVLADISATSGGSAIAGSTVTTADIAGLGPASLRFWGPDDDTDTLYLRVPSDASLGVQKIEADPDPRLDALEAAGAIGGIAATIADAKGDLIAASAADTVARLAVGGNGAGLVADSAAATGLKWLAPQVFNVKAPPYNAVGDGVANDTAAFQAARTAAAATSHVDPAGVNSNRVSRAIIEIPAGDYLITSPDALMDSLVAARTSGLVFKGAGRDVTRIIFSPPDPSPGTSFLLSNYDAWLRVHFQDIAFVSTVAAASFMDSVSTGGAQNYTFERCMWYGTWRYGFRLSGTNTNSEFTFEHCSVHGTWDIFFLSGIADDPTEDQFLNYTFYDCAVEYVSGTFLYFTRGGNIRIHSGSYIITDAAGGTLFDLRGNSHASGVQQFSCDGARFEMRNTSSHIIRCEWGRGNVTFRGCDDDSQAPFVASTAIIADFYLGSSEGPVILWENCALQGQHRYNYDTSAWQYPHDIKYDACLLSEWDHPADFIAYVETGGHTNLGARPEIEFTNCHGSLAGSAGGVIAPDTVLGWDKTVAGTPRRRVVSAKNAAGKNPLSSASVDVTLPLGAVVVGVHWFLPAGAVGSASTTWSFGLQTQEGTPTVLDTCALGTAMSAGFERHTTTFFVCGSDLKRKLRFTSNAGADASATSALFLVEYIA